MTSAKSSNSDKFILGLDFGTLSGRALLLNARTGAEVASVVEPYASGVISDQLPGSRTRLERDTALQDPDDYLRVLWKAVPKAMRVAGIQPGQVKGIGVDFTSCTILPTKNDGTPLCRLPRWRKNPHAWVKLWKHHAAQPQADRINAVGQARQEEFIAAYGGKYSSEWFFSKVLETVEKAPAVYQAADRILEAGDWLVWQLCGVERRCLSAAGFKAMRVYPKAEGGWTFPSPEFFAELHPLLRSVIAEKVGEEFHPLGSAAGGLTKEVARKMGLLPGTPVAVANIDAHAAIPACGVSQPAELVMIMGTSTCHLMVDRQKHAVEGMCGVVENGVLPGYWGYEAGQSGVGDLFAWFVEKIAPLAGQNSGSSKKACDSYAHLEKAAAAFKPGETGLVALDWWNGNRSVLVDANLTGVIAGLTLTTTPAAIYRCLLEATAFGTQTIIDAFTSQGVAIQNLVACGGLAARNPLLLQIYADVTGRTIELVATDQASARGAAIYGALAAGVYPSMEEATRRLASPRQKTFRPNRSHHKVYRQVYAQYLRLQESLGREQASPLKVLREIQVGIQP